MAIATRTFKRGEGGPAPIQIQAQFLRDLRDCEPAGPLSGFAITLDDEAQRLGSRHERARWLQKDVERAIAAAQKAGVDCYRVEIALDGTISIVVGAPSDRPAVPDAA